MKKSHKIVIAIALIGLVLLAGKMARDHGAYVRDLEDFRVRELHEWTVQQRGSAYSLDRAVAEILVAYDDDHLEAALEDALQRAHRAQENLWGGRAPTTGMLMAVDRGGFRHAYESASAYLHYLLEREVDGGLNAVEVQNLELIRSYASLFWDGFDELMSHIQYEETNFYRLHRWSRVRQDDQMVAVLNNLGQQLRLMDGVGADDRDYRAFIDGLRSDARPYQDYGVGNSGERAYSQEEMLEQAKSFARTIMRGEPEVATAIERAVPSVGRTDHVVVSEGYCSSIGDHATFGLQDSETGWSYDVSVTATGGHVFVVKVNESVSEIGSREATLELAETLLARWAEFEGVSLEEMLIFDREQGVRMAHAVVIDDVLFPEQVVWTQIPLDGSHSAIEVNADRYFALYGHPQVPEPGITAAEAISLLSPALAPAGEVRLEFRGNRLLYGIPVTGVDRVYKVYVNAVSGQYERMEYEYRRVEDGDVRLP